MVPVSFILHRHSVKTTAEVGRNYDLPFVQFVDGKGDMTAETPYAGIFVKKADPLVLTGS